MLNLRLRLALVCQVCDRDIDSEQQGDDLVDVALFGSLPYASCPGCHQIAGRQLMNDPEYRRRARVRNYLNTGRVWAA